MFKNKYKLDLQLFAEGEPEKTEAEKKVDELTGKVQEITNNLKTLQEDNKKLNTELASTKQELETTNKELSDTRDAYKEVFGEGNERVTKTTDTPKEKTLLQSVAECEL